MTKKDMTEIPPADPPHGFGPTGAAAMKSKDKSPSSLEDTLPGTERPVDSAAPTRRPKKQDREAGPSEKQIYVPPVTLPPNKEQQIVDSQKIRVAPAVMVVSDERSRPTIRRIPVQAAAALAPAPAAPQTEARTVGGRTARFEAVPLPPPEEPQHPAIRGLPTRTQRLKPGDNAPTQPSPGQAAPSPWGTDGDARIDKEALPSAQLQVQAPSRPAAAKPAAQSGSRAGRWALLVVVAGLLAGSAFVLLGSGPKPDTRPITLAATAPPEPPATTASPPSTPPVETAAPVQTVAAAPVETAPVETAPPEPPQPPPVSLPQPLESRPPPTTTKKQRPSPPVETPATSKPTATAQPTPAVTTAPTPPPATAPTEPPRPPDGAPPRPF